MGEEGGHKGRHYDARVLHAWWIRIASRFRSR